MFRFGVIFLLFGVTALLYHFFTPRHIFSLSPYEVTIAGVLLGIGGALLLANWIIRLASVPRTIRLEEKRKTVDEIQPEIIAAIRTSASVRAAVDVIFEKHRIPKKEIYERVMAILSAPQETEEVKMTKDVWDLPDGGIVSQEDMWSVSDDRPQGASTKEEE